MRMMCPTAGWLRLAIGCTLLAAAAAGRDEDGKMPEGVTEMYSSNFDMQISNVRWSGKYSSSFVHPC